MVYCAGVLYLSTEGKMRERLNRYEWILLVLGVVTFWALRIAYWTGTSEAMFSDMADFDATARGILSDFNFNLMLLLGM